MSDTILQTENLTKKIKDRCVVNHVSITLNRGDVYELIGNGSSGKTVFMRLVCGLAKPSEGSVSLFGATGGRERRKARRAVGSMVGEPALYRELTAMENLVVQSRYFRHPVSREEMWELLEQVGLENVGRRRVGRFTAGMRRQLGVALTLVGKPELIILDEPYLEVPDERAEQIRRLLVRLNREKGLSILFGSVTAGRFPGLATRCGFLHEGRLVRELREDDGGEEA